MQLRNQVNCSTEFYFQDYLRIGNSSLLKKKKSVKKIIYNIIKIWRKSQNNNKIS